MDLHGLLDVLMFVCLALALMLGAPVAFALAGVALIFAGIGLWLGVFDAGFVQAFPSRVYATMTNPTLTAVPLFILMGAILERSKLAEDLLTTMGDLMGRMRGGLVVSATLVGALLAASTGVVGATVVTMGLLSLPVMLNRGYDPRLATGTIAAAGALGQIIPPSIVLILLGDVIGAANQRAQLQGDLADARAVSVGDLFAGAIIPGLLLVGLYIAYQIIATALNPKLAPPGPAQRPDFARVLSALTAPLALIIAVLGSILAGVATPTEAAALGALGAALLAGYRRCLDDGTARSPTGLVIAAAGAAGVLLFALVASGVDLRLGRADAGLGDQLAIAAAVGLSAMLAVGSIAAGLRLSQSGALREALRTTAEITAMVFTILIGAALFALVFRGLGGDEWIEGMLAAIPGGVLGALIVVNLVVFILGFFLDFIEICYIIVPLTAPALIAMGVDPVWLGVMLAMNLQTSFLTPPFGFALFYLRGVAPASVSTLQIYRGVLPFIALQILALILVASFPALATWLPEALYK